MSDRRHPSALEKWVLGNKLALACPEFYGLPCSSAEHKRHQQKYREAEAAASAELKQHRRAALSDTPTSDVTRSGEASQRGPRPLVDDAQVKSTRRRLLAESKPSGERSIAKELGVSRDTVRYAEGKDRRRKD